MRTRVPFEFCFFCIWTPNYPNSKMFSCFIIGIYRFSRGLQLDSDHLNICASLKLRVALGVCVCVYRTSTSSSNKVNGWLVRGRVLLAQNGHNNNNNNNTEGLVVQGRNVNDVLIVYVMLMMLL